MLLTRRESFADDGGVCRIIGKVRNPAGVDGPDATAETLFYTGVMLSSNDLL